MERAELRALVLATGCAVERGGFVFLCDPQWGERERAQLAALLGKCGDEHVTEGWLCVPSGGTSGRLKFARHDEGTLRAAVAGFCGHCGVRRVNAVDVLPAHHVSGLMARVRCAATGGRHVTWSGKELEAGRWPELGSPAMPSGEAKEDEGWVLSLVPTQLQRLLGVAGAVTWLRGFRVVFVGGGPTWPGLAEAAAQAGVPVSLCYGMTETAAMVAASRPEAFLAGDRSCGTVLPHAVVEVVAEETGRVLPRGATGLVRVAGGSVCRGYFGDAQVRSEGVAAVGCAAGGFATEDLGRFDAEGRLQILGRRDAVIITGGKKVFPAEVEARLRESGLFDDVAVIGLPDPEWGQRVVACHAMKLGATAESAAGADAKLDAVLAELAPHQRPKQFVALATWPRNEQGKLDRAALMRAVLAASGE